MAGMPLVLLLLACAAHAPAPTSAPATDTVALAPRLADLPFHGDPRLVAVARHVVEARIALAPNLAADNGLVDDAVRVPSFAPDAVAAALAGLRADLAALDALPVATWPIHDQVDARLVRANAEEAILRLETERRWTWRPAEWLEPVANTLVAFATQAPERKDLAPALAAKLPGMFDEMRREMVAPTRRDLTTALGLLDGIDGMLGGNDAVRAYRAELAALSEKEGLPEYRVVGAAPYEARLSRALLLPWDAAGLLSVAEAELVRVDARIAELTPKVTAAPPPTPEETAAAEALDRDGLMRLYETVVAENLADLRAMGVLTVPDDLPPLRARETPDAILPFTGDGGSMNPLPPFGSAPAAWWNVEHFSADWPLERRLDSVVSAGRQDVSGMGTYAVHEGVPGHHLQLALLRDHPDPLRVLLADTPSIEGWALYAEQLFWEGGGFGDSAQAELNVLRSYRGRIRRVMVDANVETGRWTLQDAAAWKYGKDDAPVDQDILRAIQWPTQLIAYFAGKRQIVALREEVRAKRGAAYSEREFHDALLAAGPIPVALVRAEMLGEPLP